MEKRSERILNYTIFGFLILFVLTLNNSIFLNQIGYFGALLVLVFKSFYKRENQFQKTGLEIIFVLFIAAEILSTIFALDKPQSFHNLLKRVLLIPVVYTVFSFVNSLESLKKIFYFFIAGSIVTILVYLFSAYQHFISHLYQIESKAPSTFQYVMTAGGLISFTTIFLFSFLINEKQKIIWKILTLFLFGLSFIALLASYTRAAWIGALAGIFTIILVKRIWLIIIPSLLIGIYILFGISTISEIKIIDLKSNLEKSVKTEGRAWNIYADKNRIIEADYEGGINIYDSELNLRQNLKLDYPAVDIKKINDSTFFAASINLQLFLFRDENNQLALTDEFFTKGRSIDFDVFDSKLYVLDLDSGLTIFDLREKSNVSPELSNFSNISVNNNLLAGFSTTEKKLQIYSLEDGLIDSQLISKKYDFFSAFVWISDSIIFMQSNQEFLVYKLKNKELFQIANPNEISGIKFIETNNDLVYGVTFDNKILRLTVVNNGLNSEIIYKSDFTISDLYPYKDFIAITYNKVNRFTSIIDPYHDTNLERFNQWSAGFRMFLDYPIFGVGDIDLHKLYKDYKKPFEKLTYGHLHNNYIHLLVILGGFGFLVVMTMLFLILKKHFIIFRTVRNEKFLSSISLGAFASFIGFLVSGLAEWNFGDHEIITMVWFSLALNLIVNKVFFQKREMIETKF